MQDADVTPELEVFDLGMLNVLRYLKKGGLLASPCYVNLLFGNIATAQANLLEIGTLVHSLPLDAIYSLAGLGSAQLPVAMAGVAMADGVRIGLEDNLWLDSRRQHLATNLSLVQRVHQAADWLGRSVMTPRELRVKLLSGTSADCSLRSDAA
jgi:uncharacterized protein (DUF849 family)